MHSAKFLLLVLVQYQNYHALMDIPTLVENSCDDFELISWHWTSFQPQLIVKTLFHLMQWVLSSKEINFPYPVALTLLHMVFSSVVCFAITKVFKVLIHELITTHNLFAVWPVRGVNCYNWDFLCFHLVHLFYRSGNVLTINFYLDDISQIIKIEEGMTTDMWVLAHSIFLELQTTFLLIDFLCTFSNEKTHAYMPLFLMF
jgi:hypothetical protein